MENLPERDATKLIKKFEELKAAYDSSPIGLCVLDRDLHFTNVNESLAKLDGIPAEEHLGKTPREVVPFDFSGGIESLALSVIEKGEPVYDIEFSESPVPGSGEVRHWSTHMLPVMADDGRVQAVNIAVEDITTRKKTEEERARLIAILESTSDLVATSRTDGTIRYMNPAGRRMLGWDGDEDIQMHSLSDAHPKRALRTAWDEGIPEAFRRGVWEGENTIIYRDGREMPVSQVIMTHRAANGEPEFMSTVMRDISEQKQTEEALRESEANLREAQEIARMGRWELDLVTWQLTWSEGIFALFEISRETFAASYEAFLEFVHPGDRTLVDRAYRESVESKTPYEIEHRLLMKDGRIKWVNEIGRTEYDDTGLPVRSVGIVQEITERKQAEEAMRASEIKYRRLHQNIRDAFVSTDMDGHIKDYNESYLVMLGYSPEELSSFTYKDVTPEKWHAVEADIVEKQVLIKGYSDIYEKEYRKKDGTVFPVELRTILIRDDAGFPVRMWAMVRDITERKRIEEELRKSEARFRSYFELPIIGIAITSLEKGWIEVNDRMCDIMGYPRDELLAMTWAELTHPDDVEADVAQFDRVLSGEIDGYFMDKRFIRKNGETVWASLSVRCVRLADGRPDYFLSVVQDITERKRSEEKISRFNAELEKLVRERTAELEDKHRALQKETEERWKAEEGKRSIESQLAQTQRIEALDRFAGGIAHDLNNILYPIIINTEELLAESPLDSSRHDILNQILKAANRQRDLVKKILSFSRRSEQKLVPIKVAPLMEDTTDFLRSSLPSTIKIKLQIDAPTELIMGDPTQIQQVIMNLCQNATDALESGKGTIEIRLTKTHLEQDHIRREIRAGDYLKLVVRDTGKGIAPDVADHIFEPFYTTKAVGKGTGMGLSVVHGIVNSHGGFISVESQPGQGASFTVYLPVYTGEALAQASSPETGPHMEGKEKILLVDDEEFILTSLQRVLEKTGYRVAAAKDSLEALKLFEKEPYEFDLVITDLTMPNMTGLELSRKVMAVRPELPVILCTGFNDAINEQEASSMGIRELLLKPTDSGELKKIVRRALEV